MTSSLIEKITNSAPPFVTADEMFSRKPTRRARRCEADFGGDSFHTRHPRAMLCATDKRRTSILCDSCIIPFPCIIVNRFF